LRLNRGLAPFAALALAGCAGAPSTMAPRGPAAARIADLWWLMLALATAVFALVVGGLLWALFRPGRGRVDPVIVPVDRGPQRFLLVGSLATGAVLLALMAVTFPAMRWLGAGAAVETTVEVIGHQWWWEVKYPQGFATANELHVPVGQPVQINLGAEDVIHSFWVPQLQGKMDAIPGRSNTTWIQADQPGEYRTLCAEYCGIQHAHMDLIVVAESAAQYGAWVDAQRRPAAQPSDPARLRGAQAFARVGCIACHAVRYGSGAAGVGGALGPDLTHLASRRTLAAGRLENNPDNLAGWLANPQALKPGNQMPRLDLSADDLRDLVDYLSRLE
jgi:cytochrome c oxidase subunit 2